MSEEVSVWLNELGLGQHADAFEKNAIVWNLIPKLNHELLKEIGINSVGHRMQILEAAAELDSEQPPAKTGVEQPITTGEAERRQLTVMFCDLAGSTELSQQLDPEELREINRFYQDACKEAIERYEGYVARYMGDGVLAYFGYPQAHEDDAERAVYAGLSVVESVTGLKAPLGDGQDIELSVRVGIATGPVVVGDLIGKGASQESAVVGETPNLAARLQGAAAIDTVVITTVTHNLAGGRFVYEDMGYTDLKGIAEAVQVWRVVAPSKVESRFEAMHRSGLTPMIGRQHEIGLLLERWEYAKEGDGQVVFFSGEPGIGKSRITEALYEQASTDNPILLRYQCSAYHLNSALHPVIEQLERFAGLSVEDSPGEKLEKLKSLNMATQSMASAPYLFAQLLSIPLDDKYVSLKMPPEQLKEATLDALVLLIQAYSQRQPVLLVFEDVHWADPTSIELLGLVISRIQALPILMIMTFRLEFTPPWTGPSHITSLRLNRFSRSRAIKLIEGISGNKPISAEISDQIIEKADGVPLFLEELTRTVIEYEQGANNDDPDTSTDSMPTLAIPNTLHDLLMARLDRSASMREVAQIAAVIGREFSHDLIAAVSTLSSTSLNDALDRLSDAALIFRHGSPPSVHYVFKHALVQDAAYESLLKSKRRELHARIASVLDDQFAGKSKLEPELLAHHYTEAGLDEPARGYWLKAGRQAIRQSAHLEAISHFRQGLSMVDLLPDSDDKIRNEIEILVDLGVPLLSKYGAASAVVGEHYLRAEMLCEQLGETEHLYPILWGLWFHRFMSTQLRQAGDLANRLLEVGQARNDTEMLLEAHHCQWAVRLIGGDITGALKHCDKGLDIYQPDRHHALTFTYGGHDPGACALNVTRIALWILGYQEQSQQKSASAMKLAIELGHSSTLADCIAMDLVICILQRDQDSIEQWAKKLSELAETENMIAYQNLANGLIGWVIFQCGDRKQGMASMLKSAQQWIETANAWTMLSVTIVAECLGQMGEVERGLKMLEDTISLAQRLDVHWCEAELYRVKGMLLIGDESPAAEDALRQAMEIAGAQGAKTLQLKAAVNLAELWQVAGKADQARELVSPVYEWFTEGFETPELINAKELLEQLT